MLKAATVKITYTLPTPGVQRLASYKDFTAFVVMGRISGTRVVRVVVSIGTHSDVAYGLSGSNISIDA